MPATLPARPDPDWVHFSLPRQARDSVTSLREALEARYEAGGLRAIEGMALFTVRTDEHIEGYLSPRAAQALAALVGVLETDLSAPPPAVPSLKLEEGDRTLWQAVRPAA
ncbi:MAG TPA: hypothetical protein VD962_11955 [Rubricoccaceae bacterium]|nr:hypothetical protein [Rubricoccaceae bacterium]